MNIRLVIVASLVVCVTLKSSGISSTQDNIDESFLDFMAKQKKSYPDV